MYGHTCNSIRWPCRRECSGGDRKGSRGSGDSWEKGFLGRRGRTMRPIAGRSRHTPAKSSALKVCTVQSVRACALRSYAGGATPPWMLRAWRSSDLGVANVVHMSRLVRVAVTLAVRGKGIAILLKLASTLPPTARRRNHPCLELQVSPPLR